MLKTMLSVWPVVMSSLVMVATSVQVPRANSEGFVGDLLLLCCCSLCLLFNGKVDNQVQMLFVKAFAANCVCVAANYSELQGSCLL